MKYLLFILIATFCSSVKSDAQVTIEQRIDTMQILIGEQAKLTLSVSLKKGQKVLFPQFKSRQEITRGLEVLDGQIPDSTDLDDGLIKVSKTYILTSFNENIYRIPGMSIKVDGKTYNTKDLALKVLTVPVDTVHADKYYPPKDVQDNPFLWQEWAKVFWVSLAFSIVLCFAVYIAFRLKINKPIIRKVKMIRYQPPHQKAIIGIENLKSENKLHSDDQKVYYTKLTDILRKYIGERFRFDAMEMTSSEIIEKLRSQGNEAIDEVVNLFCTADLVKFARYSVHANEDDINLLNALSFINETKTEEKESIKIIQNKDDNIHNNKRQVMRIFCALSFIISFMLFGLVVYLIYSLT